MKYSFEIKEVSKDVALDMIQKYHYSNTLPHPKEKDLTWKTYDLDSKKWVDCGKPPYKTDFSKDFNKDELIQMIKKAGGDL